jgi:hypothetical protein
MPVEMIGQRQVTQEMMVLGGANDNIEITG